MHMVPAQQLAEHVKNMQKHAPPSVIKVLLLSTTTDRPTTTKVHDNKGPQQQAADHLRLDLYAHGFSCLDCVCRVQELGRSAITPQKC